MAHIYVVDSSTSLGLRQGQLIIRNPALENERSIPLANVDGISVFGMAQLSTQLIRTCLAENISVGYYTDDGHYIGKTSSFPRSILTFRNVKYIYPTTLDFAWSGAG